MKLMLALILAALVGCESLPKANVDIPSSLLQECGELYLVEGKTGKPLTIMTIKNAKVFHECKDMHSKLIQAVKPKE
jgi:hypothetical protein